MMKERVGTRHFAGIRRILAAALTLVLLLTLYPAQPAYAADTATYTFDFTYDQSDARSMLHLINDFRTGDDAWVLDENNQRVEVTGLGKLTYDYGLEAIAMQRAAEICTFWGHTRPNGQLCFSLFDSFYGTYGENLAAGSSNAQAAFVQWQETNKNYAGQGHRRNMLERDYNYIGIAKCRIGRYWFYVQEFSSNPSSTPAVDASDGTKAVAIEFQNSYLEDSLRLVPAKDSVTLTYGKSTDLPQINLTMRPYDSNTGTSTWPENTEITTLAEDCTFIPEDETIAAVSDGKINAQNVGSTRIAVIRGALEASIYIEVKAKNLSKATVTLDQTSFSYDGKKHQPKVASVVLDGKTLIEDVDYEVSQDSDVLTNEGEGKVLINGIGNYYGSASAAFSVSAPGLARPVISKVTNKASGITITWGKIKGADRYEIYRGSKKIATVSGNTSVTYTDTGARTNGTKYTYRVRAVSKTAQYSVLSAAKISYFVSRPAKPVLKNSKAGKLAITWKKNSAATGYRIKYVTGSTSKTVTLKSTAAVSKTLTVQKGKTYKVYVRTYKKVGSVNYWSAWSPAASLKITK